MNFAHSSQGVEVLPSRAAPRRPSHPSAGRCATRHDDLVLVLPAVVLRDGGVDAVLRGEADAAHRSPFTLARSLEARSRSSMSSASCACSSSRAASIRTLNAFHLLQREGRGRRAKHGQPLTADAHDLPCLAQVLLRHAAVADGDLVIGEAVTPEREQILVGDGLIREPLLQQVIDQHGLSLSGDHVRGAKTRGISTMVGSVQAQPHQDRIEEV